MQATDQHAVLDAAALSPADRARLWREARHGSLECLTATFRRHRYAPHSHDTFVVGVIEAGCETFRLDGVRQYAPAGSVCLVNPGAVHDGAPAGEGYAYRMTYPSEHLLREVAAEMRGGATAAVPRFRVGVLQDPQAYALLRRAHHLLDAGGPPLAADEALIEAYALLIARYADTPARLAARPSSAAVARAREWLDAHHAERVDLATLADVAGLSRHHLVRAFRRATGLSPHAWQTNRRIATARRLLAAGQCPAEVAASCGFCDQSHLHRAFRARVGIAPGAYRCA